MACNYFGHGRTPFVGCCLVVDGFWCRALQGVFLFSRAPGRGRGRGRCLGRGVGGSHASDLSVKSVAAMVLC